MNKQRNILHHMKLAEKDGLNKMHVRKSIKKHEPWALNLRQDIIIPKIQPTVMDNLTL